MKELDILKLQILEGIMLSFGMKTCLEVTFGQNSLVRQFFPYIHIVDTLKKYKRHFSYCGTFPSYMVWLLTAG